MKLNKLHKPDGVRDYLPADFCFKIQTQRRIERVFNSYAYECLSTPTFEYVEVFATEINDEQIYKFLDRDGSVLALRSDMTPAIARIAATAYSEAQIPMRFCYFENAFRCNESYQGKLREFTQAGVELIGVSSDDATAEVIAISVNGLIAAGLENFKIYIGQVQFLNGLIEEAGLDEETSKYVRQCIANCDFVSVEKILELPPLIGGFDIIKKAAGLVKNQKSLNALRNLESIYDILKSYGIEQYIYFDLSMIGQSDYYTGVIFRGYAEGASVSIIDGGRYDNLLARFGRDYPSVGSAIKINALISALERQNIAVDMPKADTLVAYTNNGRGAALEIADQLREQGLFIENSFAGGDIDVNIEYAKKRGLGGILFFNDSDNITIIDLRSDTRKAVTRNELLEGILCAT